MFGYIYVTENLVNGKKYIGKHVSEEYDPSYIGSGKILRQAINKEGKENFSNKILEQIGNVPTMCDTIEQLNYSEWYYIKYFNCVESDSYYNLKEGGEGGSCKGLTYIRKDGQYKRVFEEEIEYFISLGWEIGGPIWTEESISKRAESNTGKKRTQNQKQNISKGIINHYKENPMSEERRIKCGNGRRGKEPHNKGMIRMHNPLTSEYVQCLPKEQLKYEQLGFVRGTGKQKNPNKQKNSDNMKDRVYINDGTQTLHILSYYVNSYLLEGWKIGRAKP